MTGKALYNEARNYMQKKRVESRSEDGKTCLGQETVVFKRLFARAHKVLLDEGSAKKINLALNGSVEQFVLVRADFQYAIDGEDDGDGINIDLVPLHLDTFVKSQLDCDILPSLYIYWNEEAKMVCVEYTDNEQVPKETFINDEGSAEVILEAAREAIREWDGWSPDFEWKKAFKEVILAAKPQDLL